jgi:transposase
LVTDGRGLPLTVEVTAGQVHDSTQVEAAMEQIAIPQPLGRPRKRPDRLAGDKGYSCSRVRDWLRQHGIKPLIPHKDNELARYDGRFKFDKQGYKRRSIIEQTIGWLKECRRIGTRFEKLAVNFLAMMKLAMIQRCLRIVFSDRA